MAEFDAFMYAEQLTVLKHFTSNATGIAKVADILKTLCKSKAEAEWLVAEMLELDEWPGPATMRTMYREKFGRTDEQPKWERPQIRCTACEDLGTIEQQVGREAVRVFGREAVRVRCNCEAGQTMPDAVLALYNSCKFPKPMKSIVYRDSTSRKLAHLSDGIAGPRDGAT